MPPDFLQTPSELFLSHMPLNAQDIKSLRATCRYFSFFRNKTQAHPLGKGDTYILMDNIINFRLKEVAKIVRNNPQALFDKICYEQNIATDAGSSNFIAHSPIQRAFIGLDSYMWSSIYEIIKDDPKLLIQYKKQLNEIHQYFDIQPLAVAYDIYIDYFRKEKPDFQQEKDNSKLDRAIELFKQVRYAQEAIPMHMIYEMCRPGITGLKKYEGNFKKEYFNSRKFTWYSGNSPDSCRFEITSNPPPPAKIILFFEGEGITQPLNNLFELDKMFKESIGALVRFDYTVGAFASTAFGLGVEYDKNSFLKLHEIRYNELIQHKNLLLGFSNDDGSSFQARDNSSDMQRSI